MERARVKKICNFGGGTTHSTVKKYKMLLRISDINFSFRYFHQGTKVNITFHPH